MSTPRVNSGTSNKNQKRARRRSPSRYFPLQPAKDRIDLCRVPRVIARVADCPCHSALGIEQYSPKFSLGKSYRESLAIFQRLVASDPSNIDWQSGLSLSYGTIGEVLRQQGKLDDALKRDRSAVSCQAMPGIPSCENPNWLSCLRRVKRLFTGEVFTQNSNLSCTSA